MTRNCGFKDRVKSYIFDFIFFSIFYHLVFLFGVGIIIEVFKIDIRNTDSEKVGIITYNVMIFSFKIYVLFKDFLFKNGSLAKKAMKVKVIDAQTGERPSKKKLILRNIFYITPLTTVVNLAFCFKRLDNLSLGDLITKTRVVYIQDETEDGYVSPN